MKVNKFFIVQFILNSLLSQYGSFQMHNSIKNKYDVNELASMVINEEARLQ